MDIPEHGKADPDYKLTVDDLKNWESANGQIDEGCFVIMRYAVQISFQ